MPGFHDWSGEFPNLEGFSAEDRAALDKATKARAQRTRKIVEASSAKAEQIVDEMRGRVHDLLGPANSAGLRAAMAAERLRFSDLMQPPGGLTVDRAKAGQARKRKVDALVRKFGAATDQLRRIGEEAQARLEEALAMPDGKITQGFHLETNRAKWLELSPLHEYPLPWGLPDDPVEGGWSVFRPPFFGFMFRRSIQATSAFVCGYEHILDPGAGHFGQIVTMDGSDVGDYGAASVTVDTSIAFGYTAPSTGLIECWSTRRTSWAAIG